MNCRIGRIHFSAARDCDAVREVTASNGTRFNRQCDCGGVQLLYPWPRAVGAGPAGKGAAALCTHRGAVVYLAGMADAPVVSAGGGDVGAEGRVPERRAVRLVDGAAVNPSCALGTGADDRVRNEAVS